MTLDLAETLRLHILWLQADPAGVRANLRGANLRGADLCGANLRDADLRGANLRGADLYRANLCGANLREANLRGVDLCGADLRGAYLREANLRGVDLFSANLRGANLRGADLCGANLRDADLRDADLRGAKGLPIAKDSPARLQAVAATVLAQPAALQMGAWHGACGTVHCLAGWAIHQAGAVGAVLERMHGSHMAGLLLLGAEAARHFYDSNETALEWLRSISATTTQESTDGDD